MLRNEIQIRKLEAEDIDLMRMLNEFFADAFQEPETYLVKKPSDEYLRALLKKNNRLKLATRLIEALKVESGRRGAWVVYVHADPVDIPAVKLYESLGVREDETQLILGGDCSIVTGTMHSLYSKYAEDIHLIVIDAHIDAYGPSADRCLGAAGMGLWFLLEENDFFHSLKGFSGNNVTIVGYQHESDIHQDVKKHSLSELREKGLRQVMQQVLREIPQNRKILVHLDMDAISKEELHAVSSPSNTGLSMLETTMLLREILGDARTAGIEFTEFFPPFDGDGSQAKKVVDMLSEVFSK